MPIKPEKGMESASRNDKRTWLTFKNISKKLEYKQQQTEFKNVIINNKNRRPVDPVESIEQSWEG